MSKKASSDNQSANPSNIHHLGRVSFTRVAEHSSLGKLIDMTEQATTGEVTAFAWVAIGPEFSSWCGTSGGMTRQDRINLLGQLQLLQHYLLQAEDEANQ